MDLVLHVADSRGRLPLEGIVEPGAHYLATSRTGADGQPTGEILLSPVTVKTTAVKRAIHDPYNSLPPGSND